MTTLNGIDVSAAGQGDEFNWAPYKGKVQFAFTKISEGLGFTDPAAARNIAQMRELGLVPGGYHFLHASLSGAEQAEVFLAAAAKAGLGAGCLVALDAEDLGMDGCSAAQMDVTAASFTAQYRKHHPNWPLAYTEISIAPSLVNCGNNPLWLANPDHEHTGAIGPWKNGPSFEQVGQRGIDTDLFYGTAAELGKLVIQK